jgi:hypothetical protein
MGPWSHNLYLFMIAKKNVKNRFQSCDHNKDDVPTMRTSAYDNAAASRDDVPPRRTFDDDDAAAQRLRPEPHDVYHIAQLLPSCTLGLEKDLRPGPPKYPKQKATISKRQPSADEQPDNTTNEP